MQVAGTWMQGQQLEDVQQAERLKLGSLKVWEYRRKRSFYSIYLFKKIYKSSTILLTISQWFKQRGPKNGGGEAPSCLE